MFLGNLISNLGHSQIRSNKEFVSGQCRSIEDNISWVSTIVSFHMMLVHLAAEVREEMDAEIAQPRDRSSTIRFRTSISILKKSSFAYPGTCFRCHLPITLNLVNNIEYSKINVTEANPSRFFLIPFCLICHVILRPTKQIE